MSTLIFYKPLWLALRRGKEAGGLGAKPPRMAACRAGDGKGVMGGGQGCPRGRGRGRMPRPEATHGCVKNDAVRRHFCSRPPGVLLSAASSPGLLWRSSRHTICVVWVARCDPERAGGPGPRLMAGWRQDAAKGPGVGEAAACLLRPRGTSGVSTPRFVKDAARCGGPVRFAKRRVRSRLRSLAGPALSLRLAFAAA